MVKRALGAAWNTWRSVIITPDTLAALRSALQYWQKRELARAWVSWMVWLMNRRKERNMLARSVMRLVARELARALGKWRTSSKEMAWQARLLRGTVLRWQQRTLARGLNTWRHAVAAANHEKNILKGAEATLVLTDVIAISEGIKSELGKHQTGSCCFLYI